MGKAKLLFHINSMGKGGAERVVHILSGCFAADGYEVTIVTLWRAKEEYEIPSGVKRMNLGDRWQAKEPGRLWLTASRFLDLRKTIKGEKPDLVISFCNKANFRCSYSMMGMKIPLLVSVRNDPKVDYLPYKHAVKRMERKAAGCVFQTADAMNCFGGAFQRKSRIIRNPVDSKYLSDAGDVAERGKYIVTVGRISPQKNQLLLLKAFRRIMDEFPEYELRIYGEESVEGTKDKLLQYMDQQGMEKQVKWMGQSSSLEKEIRDAALFVLPSDYEGMPNALIEAMVMGIPCISTDCPCGGPSELIDNGVSGVLVPVGDEKELAAVMKRLLEHPELADQMGKAGAQIKETVSPGGIYSEWKKFVNSLIQV